MKHHVAVLFNANYTAILFDTKAGNKYPQSRSCFSVSTLLTIINKPVIIIFGKLIILRNMNESKKKEAETSPRTGSPSPAIDKSASEPPAYYNSEPSSQPPQYTKSSRPNPQPQSPRHYQHASAASVRAVLASPDTTKPEKRSKVPWRQRWKEWMQSWEVEEGYQQDYGSQPKWNYFGARLDGGETKARKIHSIRKNGR